MQSALSKNIFSTLIYYDILNYPLTAFEVWKYLGVGGSAEELDEAVTLGMVVGGLADLELDKKIDVFRGFYFIRGRKGLVENRIERAKLSEQKFKIIRRVVFWLRFLPYVRMIAITGTVAMKNAGKNSDLDFLIVLRRGRIFLGRTLVTGLVHLMGKRRYGKKIADRVCLNCFLTDESLESRLRDLFSASEYSFTVPIFGPKTFSDFQHKNKWIKYFKVHFQSDALINLKVFPERSFAVWISGFFEKIFDLKIFNLLENALSHWQTERIAKDPRTQEAGGIIMADNEALIFFHHARSLSMDKLFKKRLEAE